MKIRALLLFISVISFNAIGQKKLQIFNCDSIPKPVMFVIVSPETKEIKSTNGGIIFDKKFIDKYRNALFEIKFQNALSGSVYHKILFKTKKGNKQNDGIKFSGLRLSDILKKSNNVFYLREKINRLE